MKIVESKGIAVSVEQTAIKDGKILLWKDGKSRAFFPIDAGDALKNGWSYSAVKPEEPVQAVEPEKVEDAVKPEEPKKSKKASESKK